MKFDSVLPPEPAPAPAPAPDPLAEVNARFTALEQQISEAYRANKGLAAPQVQYVPYPVAPPAPEPAGPTEAEILADLPTAITTMAERIAAEREQQLRQEMGAYIGSLYEKDFERDLRDLKSHPYFKDVADDLTNHFQQNPNEKLSPGRLQQKFYELVGAKMSTSPAPEQYERIRAVEPSIPISTSSAVGASARKEPVKLDEKREAVMQDFNRHFPGLMTADEWDAIENKGALDGTRD